jgi:acyl dehydratase
MSTFLSGSEIPAKKFLINRAALVQYADASGDQNPIHQDEDFAKSVGLENVIAHGMYTMGLVAQYVAEIAGGSSKVQDFSARFTKPVVVPAGVDVELVVSAVVGEVTESTAKLEITATCNEVKVLGITKAFILL